MDSRRNGSTFRRLTLLNPLRSTTARVRSVLKGMPFPTFTYIQFTFTMVNTSHVENANTPYEFLAALLDDVQAKAFYQHHDMLREQNVPHATSEEWYAFQRAMAPDGVPVDDKIATEMAEKFVDLADRLLEARFSGFRYVPVAPCRSEDLKPIPA